MIFGLRSFAVIIGLVVGFIIMVLAPLTMSGINPARDLGPRIATYILGWEEVSFPGIGAPWWVWTVGPILGAAVGGAVWVYGLGGFLERPEAPLSAGVEADELATPTPGGNPPSENPSGV
jgi:glycerol uptake facilitator protein